MRVSSSQILMSEERKKIEEISKAFEQEFERFADLSVDGRASPRPRRCCEVAELKIRHTGKKFAIAGAMKLIGKVPPENEAIRPVRPDRRETDRRKDR